MTGQQRTERVTYAGRVQGVGFRFTVRQIATQYPVCGYVRNLPDGNVELVAQGPGGDLESFLKAIAERFRGNIRGVDRNPVTDAAPFDTFEIRH